jgi:putative ATP-dependent endonuclease of OLD family
MAKDMHLSKLRLRDFRSFSNEEIPFSRPMTVLVGENNGGKSNIIDSLRLITVPLSGRRELYCETTDIRFGIEPQSMEIEAFFDDLSPPQQGRLISATTSDDLSSACFGLTFDASKKSSYVRPNFWAGRFRSAPEPGAHEMIRHVYLPPLRDAKRALASGNPSRIHALLNHFLEGQDPKEVAQKLARTADHDVLDRVDSAVAEGLDVLTSGVRHQSATLGFNTDEKLIDIARDLRFKLSDFGCDPEDLRYSGHGFANLLYMATIAVELEKTDDAELTIFLVEEPEAHLHPQLQAAVLNFLEERAHASLKPRINPNQPAGHLQVIVATHSPNLSAWVPNENLVFVRSTTGGPEVNGKADASVQTAGSMQTRPESRCIPLSKLDLTSVERRKIERYLDVTKSAMLFGGRIFLVEGIAEAVLLPVLAKRFVFNDRPDKFRKFRTAVFVPIDGVDFTPYLKVLLSPYNNVRIADRLVVVTDGDQQTAKSKYSLSPGLRRKWALMKLAIKLRASEALHVQINTFSLETELVKAGNEDILREVYLYFHPRSRAKWEEALAKDGRDQAKAIQSLFDDTPKGDFAQLLSEKILESETFRVPEYLRRAIEAIAE